MGIHRCWLYRSDSSVSRPHLHTLLDHAGLKTMGPRENRWVDADMLGRPAPIVLIKFGPRIRARSRYSANKVV